MLVEFAPGVSFPRHAHPGEEIVYVTEGVIEYQLDGKPPVTLKAGEVLFVPAGVVHTAKNVGSGKAAELATYIVKSEAAPRHRRVTTCAERCHEGGRRSAPLSVRGARNRRPSVASFAVRADTHRLTASHNA